MKTSLATTAALTAAITLAKAATYDIHLYDATICQGAGGITCSDVDQDDCCFDQPYPQRYPDKYGSAQAVQRSGIKAYNIITRAYYGEPCGYSDFAGASTSSCFNAGEQDAISSAYFILDRGLGGRDDESIRPANRTMVAADKYFQIDNGLRYSINVADHQEAIEQSRGSSTALREYILANADSVEPMTDN